VRQLPPSGWKQTMINNELAVAIVASETVFWHDVTRSP
jgi:hypothetical protein